MSCGLLLLPLLGWNVVLAPHLPEPYASAAFDRGVPTAVLAAEQVLRALVFALPFTMPLQWTTAAQRRALAGFALGALIYLGSWLPLVLAPEAAWSHSRLGLLAPAYTPALWLFALALLAARSDGWWQRRPWLYPPLAAGFAAVHLTHAVLATAR